MSWVTSLSTEQLIAALGSAASVIVLLILVYTEWIKPFYRTIKLKRPVKAHFTAGEPDQKHPHLIRQLVLSSHQLVDVEVGFKPRTHFHAIEIVFGCEGQTTQKPAVVIRRRQFIKRGNIPKPLFYTDHADYGHSVVNRDLNKGTHHVTGFRLRNPWSATLPSQALVHYRRDRR